MRFAKLSQSQQTKSEPQPLNNMAKHCPKCDSDSMVSDSRKTGNRVMRKRYCQKLGCSRQWTTYEVHESEIEKFEDMNEKLKGFKALLGLK